MEPSSGQPPAILGSLQRLVQTGLLIAQNRLELLLVEFQEERHQFFEALLLTGVVLVLGAMTLGVVTCSVVVLCLYFDRLDLLVGLALLYLLGTILAYLRLRNQLRNWTPFASTLAELKRDLTCLEDGS